MRKLTLSIAALFACATAFAQNITNPKFDGRDDTNTSISKIETNKQFTVVTFETVAPGDSSWVEVNNDMFIRTANDVHYKFVKAEDITIAPKKTTIARGGDKLTFKVYFEKIPATTKYVDVIERAGTSGDAIRFFNFYHVSLTASRPVENKRVVSVTLSPPPPPMNMHNAMDMGGIMNAMAPMMGAMTKSMLDAQVEYFKQPGKLQEIAKLTRAYLDALMNEGITREEAMKIITAEGLMPKISTTGK